MELLDAHVVALTHYLPPYMKEVLTKVAARTRHFEVLVSTQVEPNRKFVPDFSGLDVTVQKSVMLRRPWKHRTGFKDELYVHFPYDTFSLLRRAAPDIVFSYELGFRSLVSALYRRSHPKSRLAFCVCVSEHTEQGRGIARLWIRKWLIRQADAITYNGDSCLAYLKRFKIPDERLYHFPYAAIDSSRVSGDLHRGRNQSHRFVCVGQLNERKGVMPLLRSVIAFCIANPHRSLELSYIGTGPLEGALRSQATPANLRVNFIGHIPPENLCRELMSHGVLVFPTLADEWGLVVNEAMQAGLPVLGSRFAQASTSLIEEGKTGWLYDPTEPGQCETKLQTILGCTPEQLNRMRDAARAAVSDITSDRSADKAIGMFQDLIRRSHPVRA